MPIYENSGTGFVYLYSFNGLYLRSELRFPEVEESDEAEFNKAENVISVRLGVTPDKLDNPFYTGPVMSLQQDSALVSFKNIARFLINGDNEIIVDVVPEHDEARLRFLFLSTVLAVLIYRHNLLPMHAATIKVGNAAVLVAGRSGAGKSTLSMGMYLKGYEVINDDISTIFFDKDGTPMVYPGVSQLRVMAQSLEKYNYDPRSFIKLRSELEKYGFPVKRVTKEPLPVKAVFLLKQWNDNDTGCEPIAGLAKFQLIKENIYKNLLGQKLGVGEENFVSAAKLSNLPVIRVFRPSVMPPVDFAGYMEEQFQAI